MDVPSQAAPVAQVSQFQTQANENEQMEEDPEANHHHQDLESQSGPSISTNRLKRQQQNRGQQVASPDQQTRANQQADSLDLTDMDDDEQQDQDHEEQELDEERMRRMLACKRLSEGNCNLHAARQLAGHLGVCRKNSLHLFAGCEGLPPVTEGEPMRHMSHHMSQNMDGSQSSSSASSSSLRMSLGGGPNVTSNQRLMMMMNNANSKRTCSQDDNITSCSSSTSLDGSNGLRSPTRRRSSTVSQCSSVLSEGTRQQLNFDLSPDLAPDSSILEANALSPTPFDFERPASPEPSSLGSAENSLDLQLRPESRMSQQLTSGYAGDELMVASSPDSTLGLSDSANVLVEPSSVGTKPISELGPADDLCEVAASRLTSETRGTCSQEHETSIRDNLERLISNVSAVKVSSRGSGGGHDQQHQPPNSEGWCTQVAGQKRAHTPFGLNVQRNKTSHTCPTTPSPTANQTTSSVQQAAT